jgi:hypothetical protein
MADQDTEPNDGSSESQPSEAHSDLPTMPADQALQRLRNGRPLNDVCVERLVLSGEFTQPVRLKNVVLVKPRFENPVFKAELSFNRCTIDTPNFAGSVICEGDLLLCGCVLQSATLTRLTVKGKFNAEFIHTRGNFSLMNSTFDGSVRFWEASFHNWCSIKKCSFNADADFRSFHAHKGVSLIACRFGGPALFRGASVAMKFDFSDCVFAGLLDLSRAKLNDYVYLEGVIQEPGQRFAFANIIGERILVRPEQIKGRLDSEETGNHAQAMHEYAFLKRVFGAMHRYEQEDWAFYRFKVNQRRSKPRSWLRPWTRLSQFCDWLFLDLGCGYGANPMRAVAASLIIMIGFGVIYSGWIEQLNVDTGKLPFPGEVTNWPNRVMIGTLTSVSVFTSGVGGIREIAKGWLNVPLILESLLGTLLWGLFIVAFSRKVIR